MEADILFPIKQAKHGVVNFSLVNALWILGCLKNNSCSLRGEENNFHVKRIFPLKGKLSCSSKHFNFLLKCK